jgi:integrase/recombinase XerD
MKTKIDFPGLMQSFFTERLMNQKHASPHTIAAYRDTFRLLLKFAKKKLGKAPSDLVLTDLNADFLVKFLDSLEKERKIGARSRNLRRTVLRSFFQYVAFEVPDAALLINKILAIPSKRHDRALVAYLSDEEITAILKQPDRRTWIGRRDHSILLTAIQTGLRVSELVGLRRDQVTLSDLSYIQCFGKGRKERCTPLTGQVVATLRAWLKEVREELAAPVFPNIHGGFLTPDSVQYLLRKYTASAKKECPSLKAKSVSPHVLRHTTAMQLLQAGVDRSVIALWLGHSRVETTQVYLEASLKMKEEILKKTSPMKTSTRRFQAGDQLLSFLQGL